MSSEGLGEMFEGDSADTCGGKFPLVSIGGRAEDLTCADLGARTPISARGIYCLVFFFFLRSIIKTPEGGVVGFKFLDGLLSKKKPNLRTAQRTTALYQGGGGSK